MHNATTETAANLFIPASDLKLIAGPARLNTGTNNSLSNLLVLVGTINEDESTSYYVLNNDSFGAHRQDNCWSKHLPRCTELAFNWRKIANTLRTPQ